MKWQKFFIGLLGLIPLAFLCSYALGMSLYEVKTQLYAQNSLVWFGAGFVSWLLLFFILPRPMWLYVFGHELTHALGIWLFGGSVFRMKVSSRGGYVRTDKSNVWIALAPYFFPIYSGLVVWIWWLLSFWMTLDGWSAILYLLLGLTWGFHLTFTVLMLITTEQSDVTQHGWLFSMSFIYLMNILLLTFFLILLLPQLTWEQWWTGFLLGWKEMRELGLSFYQFCFSGSRL
ncbi:MAG: hypothetical protein R3F23_07495 [Verrucomicrobiia bacterium]